MSKAIVGKLLSITLQDKAIALPSNIEGEAILTYRTVVPPCLDRIVILDASSDIRDLIARDNSISHKECKRKDYSSVSLHYWRSGGGRSTVEKDLSSPHSTIDKEVARIVKNIPEDESVLVLTYKNDESGKYDIKAKLSTTMLESGIRKDRIDWLTWGKHTNLNNYAHIKYVIIVGILRRDKGDLRANYYGQNPSLPQPDSINEIEHSELAHMLYQGAMRGHARNTINDMAGNMNVWVFDNAIEEILSVFRSHDINFNFVEYTPEYMKRRGTATEVGKEWITNTLQSHGKDIRENYGNRISTRKLKEIYPPPESVSGSLLSNLFKKIGSIELPEYGEWRFEGRSCIWVTR